MLVRLHQAEMAFRQGQRRIARHRAEHRDAERRDGVGDERAMALAADAVEHHAGDAHARIVGRKAAHHGGRGLRLPGDIEHQQHRQTEPRREVGGRAARAPAAPGDAVEQAHDAFDDEQVRGSRGASRASASSSAGGIAQLSRLSSACRSRRHGRPDRYSRARPWRRATAMPRRCSAASRPSVTVVLPEPERGAATIEAACRHGGALPRSSERDRDGCAAHYSADAMIAGRPSGSPPDRPLRRGWTTGACATAAAKAAYTALLTGEFPDPVEVTLPRGERPSFALAVTPQRRRRRDRRRRQGRGRRSRRDPRRAGAGDGAAVGAPGSGVTFRAGAGRRHGDARRACRSAGRARHQSGAAPHDRATPSRRWPRRRTARGDVEVEIGIRGRRAARREDAQRPARHRRRPVDPRHHRHRGAVFLRGLDRIRSTAASTSPAPPASPISPARPAQLRKPRCRSSTACPRPR